LEKGSEPHLFSFEPVAALLGASILIVLNKPTKMSCPLKDFSHEQPQLPVLFVGSAQTTAQTAKLAKFLFFAQLIGRRGLFNSHWPVDAVVAKPLCRLVLLHQCLDSVSQYIRLAQGYVFGMGACNLPKRFDVFDLLQRSHDLWRVFKHVGVHGCGAHAACIHRRA
jgi:hypothetical protein